MKLVLKVIASGISALIVWQLILMNTVINTTGYENHPILGRSYKEGTYLQGMEGFSRTHINHLGMRNEEIQQKKDREIRILALGDSFTEAFQVSDRIIFTQLLQRHLKQETANPISVINAGRSGGSPAYYIHLADFYKTNIQQDYTIIQLNDADFTEDLLDSTRNFYVKEHSGSYQTVFNKDIQSIFPFLQKFPQVKELLEYSVFHVGADKIQKILAQKKFTSVQATTSNHNGQDFDSLISWTVTEFKQQYPNLVLLYLPSLDFEQIDAQPSEIEHLVEVYAQKNNVPIINMRKPFVQQYVTKKQPVYGFNNTIPGDGHSNSLGHQLIADELIDFFEGRLKD
ncbi:SGNH/GDSL hydrolase family protein [Pseudoneobacillus sp. C159]